MFTRQPQSGHPDWPLYPELGRNSSDRPDGEPSISGTLPERLSGVLFRNGPGMFTRNGSTKGTVLDGDGIVQRLELLDGKARYSRRFVRTPKFLAEEAAHRFLMPTWTTQAKGFVSNLGNRVPSQAGITSYLVNGVLYALDEVAPGFELDPVTLETRKSAALGLPDQDRGMKAHARYLPGSRDWIFASTRMGRNGMQIDFVRHRPNGERIATPTVQAPRMSFVHDFGATEHHAIVILQPAILRPLRYLSGLATYADSLEWRARAGNVVLVIDLETGVMKSFEAPTSWVWHIGNAYEHDDEVVLDFVGYEDPEHFLGHNAQLAAVMYVQEGVRGAPGHLRRYVMNRRTGQLTEIILSDGNFEFPSIDPRASGLPHEHLYATQGHIPGMLHSGIAAVDTRTGALDTFDFGLHANVLEPVFAPRPGGRADEGWLITQVLDTRRQTSGFAILDAQHLSDGPIATVELGETMPISFHGQWVAR